MLGHNGFKENLPTDLPTGNLPGIKDNEIHNNGRLNEHYQDGLHAWEDEKTEKPIIHDDGQTNPRDIFKFFDRMFDTVMNPKEEFDLRKFARTPENNGSWGGERGDSIWIPDGDYTPPEKGKDKPYSNPDNLPWSEILKKYGIEGIPFKDGFPDFSAISKGTVEIEGFETGGNAEKNRNFNKAYVALAEQRGCSPDDVKKWMKENNYTWHECEDKKTMQKVPNEVHANVPHDGGRSQKDQTEGAK